MLKDAPSSVHITIDKRIAGISRSLLLNKAREQMPWFGMKQTRNDVEEVGRSKGDDDIAESRLAKQRVDVLPPGERVRNGEPDRPACAVESDTKEHGESSHHTDAAIG